MLFYIKVFVFDLVKIDFEFILLFILFFVFFVFYMYVVMGVFVFVFGVVVFVIVVCLYFFVLFCIFVFCVFFVEVVQLGLVGDKVFELNFVVELFFFLFGVSVGMRGFVVDFGLFEMSIVLVVVGVEFGE